MVSAHAAWPQSNSAAMRVSALLSGGGCLSALFHPILYGGQPGTMTSAPAAGSLSNSAATRVSARTPGGGCLSALSHPVPHGGRLGTMTSAHAVWSQSNSAAMRVSALLSGGDLSVPCFALSSMGDDLARRLQLQRTSSKTTPLRRARKYKNRKYNIRATKHSRCVPKAASAAGSPQMMAALAIAWLAIQ